MAARDALLNRISEIAEVVLMRYQLEPQPGIDFVSPSSMPILGYRPEEFYEVPALGLEIVHPDDREALARSCARDPEAPFVGRVVRKDGEVRWMERRQVRVADRRGRRAYLEATLRDITMQREAEEALRESEHLWQAVFDAAHDVFLLADNDRRVVAANAAAADFFGVPVAEVVGRRIDDFASHDTETRWAMFLHGGALRNEGVWRLPDGSERRVLVSATANVAPDRHLAVVQDVTEQRAMEEELRSIQLRFRTSFERAPIGMALVALDGSWLEVNRAFCEFLGYSEDELCRTTWQALTYPDDLHADRASVEAMLAGRIDGYTMEKRYVRKSGEIVIGRLSVALVRAPDGEPAYFISQLEGLAPGLPASAEVPAEPIALTNRQLEILQLLAAGRSTEQIADELFLSKTTVRNHIHLLHVALDAHSQLEAVARARAFGLLKD